MSAAAPVARMSSNHAAEGPTTGRRLLVLVLAATFVAEAWCFHSWSRGRNANELSRLYLVKAIVEDHTLAIDRQIKTHGDMQDKAAFAGHAYSDKPVGLALLGVPVYCVMHVLGAALGISS